MEDVLDEIVCKIILQNIRWYKEMQLESSEDVIHFFLVERTSETEKYYRELSANEKYVYFLFEENSGYICSNSSRLHIEEKLRRGVSEKDIKEKNVRYQEYIRIKEDVERGDILRKLDRKANKTGGRI